VRDDEEPGCHQVFAGKGRLRLFWDFRPIERDESRLKPRTERTDAPSLHSSAVADYRLHLPIAGTQRKRLRLEFEVNPNDLVGVRREGKKTQQKHREHTRWRLKAPRGL
jgi:hypothetical protein